MGQGAAQGLIGVVAAALLAASTLSAQLPAGAARAGRAAGTPRTIALDERLAADAPLRIGDRVVLAAAPGSAGDTVTVAALVRRRADPSEVARAEYRVWLHLDHLQRLAGTGDRVDRFAVQTRSPASGAGETVDAINRSAFGFRAHRSADVAVETSRTFQVVSRFHRAIGVITVVASALFLLCLLLLKVDERRRDVAALRLMGISRRTVVASVVLEAAMVSVIGSGFGALVGWSASLVINRYYQAVYRTPLAFAVVTPDTVAFAVGLSLLLGIVAGWLAAARLVRVPPLELFGR